MSRAARGIAAALLAGAVGLGGCAQQQRAPVLVTPAPYHLLPVDEAMSCPAIADSFVYSARRAARLQYWLEHGPIPSFGNDRFGQDAPLELHDERARLDALSDLQRTKGCRVFDPVAVVAYERSKYPPLPPPPLPPPPLPPPPLPPPAVPLPPGPSGPVLTMRG